MNNTHDFGLDKDVYSSIVAVLRRHPVQKAMIYGSRARGDYRNNSDIDLAIWTDGSDIKHFIKSDLDEYVPTACTFDVVDFTRTDSRSLQANVIRDGVVILS